jgi:hypothetical protein
MAKISLKSILGAIEGALDNMTELVDSGGKNLNKTINKFNLEMSAKAAFSGERSFIEAYLKLSEHELDLQKKFEQDPTFKEIYEKVEREWNVVDKEPVGSAEQDFVRRKVAEFILPEAVEEAENGKDIMEAVGFIRAKHAEFLRNVKSRLDQEPELMKVFEGAMEETGGGEILDYIKRIDADQPL